MSKAVLLAAGLGRRMRNARGLPKPLVNTMGRPLITYPLMALKAICVEEVFVVIGHRGQMIRKSLEAHDVPEVSVRFVEAENFHRGNGASLSAISQELVGDSFLLAMSDHIVSPELMRMVLESEPISLGVDMRTKTDSDPFEDTKVLVDGEGFIKDIGKTIPVWNGIDTGVFNCNEKVLIAGRELLSRRRKVTVTDIMKYLLAQGNKIQAVNVSGLRWIDVDTPSDIHRARAVLSSISET